MVLPRTTTIEDARELGVGERVSLASEPTLEDTVEDLDALIRACAAVVVVSTSSACPVSKQYAPRLGSLSIEYAERNVGFVYVNVVAAERLAAMTEFVQTYAFRGSYLPDRSREVATALGVRTTCEAFVIDRESRVVYRGAIDDQFGVGAARDHAERHFLRDAVDAVLAGRAPAVPATWPPGCLVDPTVEVASSPSSPDESPFNYARVAAIVETSCVPCHRLGGDAPFPLDAEADFEGRRQLVEAVLALELMPPIHGRALALGASSEWSNRYVLTADDRALLVEWLRAGASGDASRERRPYVSSPPWAIGTPTRSNLACGITLPAQGPLAHRRCAVPLELASDEWIRAVELRPDEPGTLHHALAWLLPPGASAEDAGAVPAGAQLLATYSPGYGVVELPAGAALHARAGSSLLIDVFARPSGRPRRDVSVLVGMQTLRVADAPALREARSLVLEAPRFELAPHERDVTVRIEHVLDRATTVLALTPYMRSRGTSISVRATLPDGSVTALFDGPRYDFRWPSRFEFQDPPALPAGTALAVEGVFDNSSSNSSCADPAARVASGPGPADEALFVAFDVL